MGSTEPGALGDDRLHPSLSTLSLGTLYEAILSFSKHDSHDAFWPAVCENTRWVFPFRRMAVLLRGESGALGLAGTYERGRYSARE